MYGLDLDRRDDIPCGSPPRPTEVPRAHQSGTSAGDPRSCAMNVVVNTAEQKLPEVKREWVKPDFRDFETPMEVTAYAARS
jgi:coenzyme PQQ precursor peptide PqqA